MHLVCTQRLELNSSSLLSPGSSRNDCAGRCPCCSVPCKQASLTVHSMAGDLKHRQATPGAPLLCLGSQTQEDLWAP